MGGATACKRQYALVTTASASVPIKSLAGPAGIDGNSPLANSTRETAFAEVAAKDQVIAELKAMLAEARRPWWRRFISS